MKISKKTWQGFVERLRKIDDRAAEKVVSYMLDHDWSTGQGRKELLDYAFAVATKYGEGAAEMACQMYDAISEASPKRIPPAEPARTATYGEVARAVNGALLFSPTPESAGAAVGRMVKTAGVDTTIQNAIRDGAEWAWIPSGDSCTFCMVLASQGWVKASKNVLKGGHASHIHNNCDCTFAVRHDGVSTVEGYDPDGLRAWWDAAEGKNSKEKLSYLRRKNYAGRKDAINAQKRAAYAKKTNRGLLRKSITIGDFDIVKDVVGDRAQNAKYHIANKVIDCIAERLKERDALDNFVNIRIKPLGKSKLFDTVMVPLGTWYKCELHINAELLNGKTLEETQELIRNNSKTVCKSIEECVDHEIAHSKQARGAMKSVVDKWNEHGGISNISEVASKDMLETLAEVSVLKDKGLYDKLELKKAERKLIEEAAKELGLW